MNARARGFTLVESLIALVLLSLGLLGAAGMLLGSLRAMRTPCASHPPLHLVRDMADRIRANPRAARALRHARMSGHRPPPAISPRPVIRAAAPRRISRIS